MTSFLTSMAFTQFDERRGRSEIIKIIQQHLSPLHSRVIAVLDVIGGADVRNERW